MNTQTRSEIIAKFKEEVKNGKILVGVGAGTGITAKSSEAGGADMLIIYNSGRYRMAGRGSLAGLLSYGDANQIVVEMGAEVIPLSSTPPFLRASAVPTPSVLWTFTSVSSRHRASTACRTSRPSVLSTAYSARILRRPAWATVLR